MPQHQETPSGRRPIRSRDMRLMQWLARRLAESRVTPNQISTASGLFAALAGLSIALASGWAAFLVGAAGIQLRLLCNLLDGMVAVEGGKKTANGDIFNELPDRFSDVFVLLGLGYAAGGAGVWLGWLAALLAVSTAYVRAFGASLGLGQDFSGPLAKPQRMALATAACLAAAVEISLWGTRWSLWIGTALLALGTAVTLGQRVHRLNRGLMERGIREEPREHTQGGNA